MTAPDYGLEVAYSGGALHVAWATAWVPQDYVVRLLLSDAHGLPVTGAGVSYAAAGGSATVTGAPVVEGAVLQVSLYAMSPSAPSQSVTIHALAAPGAPTLDNRAAGLVADWAPVAGAAGYELRLLDAAGAPVSPQPAASCPYGGVATQGWIDGTALTDRAVYQVQVRASAAGSLSDWSAAASLTLDRSTPDSAMLRAMLVRLKAAGPAFDLGPAILQAPLLSDLFQRLLGFATGAVPLTAAQVASATDAVTVQASCTLFGVAGAAAQFVFTDIGGVLQLRMTAPLGARTVQQLYDGRVLPGSQVAPSAWATGLAGFPAVSLLLDGVTGTASFSGPPAVSAWSPLNLAGASLSPPTPAMSIAAPAASRKVAYTPRFTSTLSVGGKAIPIYLEVPAGTRGWRLGLEAAAPGLQIGDLSSLSVLTGGGTGLPSGVLALNQVWLTAFDISFTPSASAPTVWWFDLGLAVGEPGGADPPVWTIIDNVLALKSLSAQLAWTLYVPTGQTVPVASASGSLTGEILIANHPVQAVVSVPVDPDGWRLSSAAPVPLAGLSDLAAYFGDANYLSQALAPLGTAQGFALTALDCRFHPPPSPSLDEVGLELTVTTWTLPNVAWFTASEIVFDLTVTAPTDSAHRTLEAGLQATLAIGDQVQVSLQGAYSSQTGVMELAWAGQPLNAIPLSGLSSLVSPQQVTGAVPAELPTGDGFFLKTLGFSYDTHQSYLVTLDLELESMVSWTIVPEVLELNSFSIELHVAKTGPSAAASTSGAIHAPITLGGVVFDLAAEKPSGADPWVLSALFSGSLAIDFSDLLSQLLGVSVTLPSGYAFPTGLTLTAAAVSLTPSTKAFSFVGAAQVDWTIDFGGAQFAISGLRGQVDFPGDPQPATGSVGGEFAFAGVTGAATVALGAAATHTVVTVDIADAASISASGQVDAIAGAGTFAAAPRPADLPLPSFASAGAVLDLTADSYLVHGQFGSGGTGDLYGGLALLVQRPDPAQPWRYAFAAGLNNWTFARLSASLAIVDQVLSVASSDAAIAVSSLDGEAGQAIAQYVPALGPAFVIKKGVSVFARLSFGQGLMTQVAHLLDVSAKGPFILTGYIPAASSSSTFTATLGGLTLLDRLAFSNLVLTYAVAQGRTLTLTGDLAVSVPLLTGSSPFSFSGAMVVSDAAATLEVTQTAQQVVNPLGIPGLTLRDLGLSFAYTFAGATAPASWSLAVHGDTTIGTVALTGRLAFKDGVAALAAVTLTKPLSIDAVFTQMIGSAWPTGLLAITFQSGAIWYAPTAVTLGDQRWAAGFNVTALVDIYFLTGVGLTLQLTEKTASQAGRAQAQVQYAHAVDWGFVKLYQDAAHATVGPRVFIDSTAADGFTVTGGFALFGAAIADLSLKVTGETTTGTATFTQDLGPFGKPSFDFTWDQSGFHVDNWPLSGLKLPDFDFDDIPGSGSCTGAVVSKLPISSKFNVHSKLTVTATPHPALRIVIDGSFDLVCNSSAYSGTLLTANIVSATLDIPLPVSGSFDWDALGQSFVSCIQGAAQSIFKNLLEDPANLAKLLAVGGVQFAAGEVTSYLVCRGVSEAAAEAFAEAASGAVSSTVSVGGGVAIAVGGVAGSIIGGIFHNGGSSDGGGDSGGGGGPPPRPAAPAAPTLSWASGLQVAWAGVDNATRYVVVHKADGGGWSSGDSVSSSPLTLALPPGPLYSVAVVAAGFGGVSAPGPAASLQTLAAPASLTAVYSGDATVTLRWTAVQGADVNGYHVSVSHAGTTLSPAPQVSGATQTGAVLTTSAFDAGGDFAITVTASSAVMTSPAATASLSIPVLAAPTGLTLACGPASVLAQWTAVSGAASYRLSVLDAHGELLSPQPAVQIDATDCTAVVSGAPLADGQTIGVKVAARATGASGAWSATASLTLLWLAAPSFGVAYDQPSHALTLAVAPTPRATGYEGEVLDHAGAPLQPPFLLTVTSSPASFDASRLTAGAAYEVLLRATTTGSLGPWASAPAINLAALAAPSAVSVTNEAAALSLAFQPVSGANLYEAEIVTAAGQSLDPPLTARGAASPLSLPADRLAAGQAYGARVRAIALSGA